MRKTLFKISSFLKTFPCTLFTCNAYVKNLRKTPVNRVQQSKNLISKSHFYFVLENYLDFFSGNWIKLSETELVLGSIHITNLMSQKLEKCTDND